MANLKKKIKLTHNTKDVPEDVITVILSRLPVKSLLRCKSVCKSWLSIISNPGFIKSHLHNATIASGNIPKIVNFVDTVQALELQDLSFTCPIHMDFIVMPRLFHETLLEPMFIGCYNGIICLSGLYRTNRSVYLWNPSIRKCMKIPSPKEYQCNLISTHFGYDSIDEDYKVLQIRYGNISDELPIIQVYSTNAKSWKDLQYPILHNWMVGTSGNIVVNGVLYINYCLGLISFNLHTEVMGLVPFPSAIHRKSSAVLNFQDSVAIIFKSINDELLYLWTLDDDVTGQMAWIKRNSVKGNLRLSFYLGMGLFFGVKPINSCTYSVVYDCAKKVSTLCEPVNLGMCLAHKYTESLVSLAGFHQVE